MAQYTNNYEENLQSASSVKTQKNESVFRDYNVNALEFPTSLRARPDLQHYIAFKINVREDSIHYSEAKNNNNVVGTVRDRKLTALSSADAQAALSSTTASAVLGATAGAVGNKLLGAAGLSKGGALKGALVGGLTGAAASLAFRYAKEELGLLNEVGLKRNQNYRIKDVITLYIQERPEVKYSAKYSGTELGTLAGFATGLGKSDTLSGMSKSGLLGETQSMFVRMLANQVSTIGKLAEIGTRTRLNPFREVLFEGMDRRSFNFNYNFFPDNETESRRIQDIISTFRTHMHPELSANKLFYVYPSEFELEYYYKDKRNEYLHKFATCALTDMKIEYGGEQFSSFKDGQPVEIRMSLTFEELELLDTKAAKDGY